MSKEPDDDAVRRLLADARHTEPMPADVAARLDGVLRDLAHDGDDLAPVVALPRRRRPAAALLAAAAAIVVGGVTFASLEHHATGAGSTAGAAASTQERGGDTSDTGSNLADPRSAGGSAGTGSSGSATAPTSAPQSDAHAGALPVRVRAHHFTSDVRRYRRALPAAASPDSLRNDLAACRVRTLGAGIRLPASYDGAKAVLVYRSPAGGSQVVDLYLCGDVSPVRTTTLPGAP